jgi:hypothetical protein
MTSLIEQLRETGREPRVHPNGFIQFDLDAPVETNSGHSGGHTRLHFWTHHLPRQEVRTSVHDHVFDMESLILSGRLIQVTFRTELQCYPEEWTHEVLLPDYSTSSSTLHKTGVKLQLRQLVSKPMWLGQSYTQPAFTFHDSILPPHEMAITLMRKTQVYEGIPRVLLPLDGADEPDNSFDRSEALPTESLWNIMETMLEDLHEKSASAIRGPLT